MEVHLSEFTKGMPIVIALGVPGLQELFDEKYYDDLRGDILEACGRAIGRGRPDQASPPVRPVKSRGRLGSNRRRNIE